MPQSPYEDHDEWYRLVLPDLKLRGRAALNRPAAEIMAAPSASSLNRGGTSATVGMCDEYGR